MGTSDDKDKKPESTNHPEQKLGDTPVPPWEMPTAEEKEQAKPVKRALKKAISRVDSQEKADEVINHLEAATAGETTVDAEQAPPLPATPAEAAWEVKQADETTPKGHRVEKVLETTARVLATPDKRQREVVSEAVQEVFDPEQQGAAPPVETEQQREYLREAVLKRLKPADALDANLFLLVNHLPHTRPLNTLFYGLTMAFNGATAWFVVMLIAVLRRRRSFRKMFWEAAVPLTITTALVEYPIKAYFRRRRPFITIIQAIVIGKKPGTWSFPSGHSAGAFGGAWLINLIFPRFGIFRYMIAGMVAFSRIYLGDHYPGDVMSGSALGMLFAMLFRWLARLGRKKR
jgi:membrane-associated phospholipid phosphatase